MALTFGILTVSDRCFKGESKDTSGPRLEQEILNKFPMAKIAEKHIVPDEVEEIKECLKRFVFQSYNVILTTGGTGFSQRDVTPEATKQIIEREANGLSHVMTSKSLEKTQYAMLSRAVCGIKNTTIIINLPGSEKAAAECFGFISESLPHAVSVLTGKKLEVEKAHKDVQRTSKVKIDASKRDRHSTYPMLEVDAATALVLNECAATNKTEEILVEESLYRILANDIFAKAPVPPFEASIKDGYAVRASDGLGIKKVRYYAAAGDTPIDSTLKEGEVIRISTGAPIPLGADAVVQVEDTKLIKSQDGEELEIEIKINPKTGQDIRKIGSDVEKGVLVIKRYNKISAADVGVMAMLGYSKVHVFKQASIGILSTGNELCKAGEPLKPGQIYDSNKLTLMNLLKEYHYQATDYGIARDNPDDVYKSFAKAFEKNDVVITSGGVSMGEFDVIKQVLTIDFNAIIHFGRINMKPGKPTTFATLDYNDKRKYVFALPGNPVSSCVTSILFVIPFLRKIERAETIKYPFVHVSIPEIKNSDARPEYARAVVSFKNGILSAHTTGSQVSSRLNSLLGANGLIIVPGKNLQDINNSASQPIFGQTTPNIFGQYSIKPISQTCLYKVLLFSELKYV
ncbi:unnamed protein product [Brassicogethes aeneus]|uniref:MoaB/Mog domain-containing protein n=1 Tax=Brassicogethes aeneus TaxID=1431903 RepID=A0A9P0B6Z1_BRAAE|nr:unnamed protein product [Brassicogethes aeneus]